MASVKEVLIGEIALLSSGTVNVNTGAVTAAPFSIADSASIYRVTGTEVLVGNFVIAPTGTASKNIFIQILWEASCTPGANTVTIFGATVPAELLASNFIANCVYNGSAWVVTLLVDWEATSIVNSDRIEADAVTTAKILNANVTYAKIQDTAEYTLLGRNAAGSGVISAAAIAAQSFVVRLAAGFVSLTPSADGQVVMRKAGSLVSSLLDFSNLDGTLAVAQIPDDEITAAKLANTLLDELYIVEVSFEAGEQCNNRIKMPFAGTVVEMYGIVIKAIAGTDNGTIVAKNAAGTTMGTGTLTFTASDALETAYTVTPSTNNTFAAGDVIYLTAAKTTAGGKARVSLKVTRS
jgi:hypothetical protein